MPKQYRIFYKRAGSQNWGTLEPHVNAALYENPAVEEALAVLRERPVIEAVVVRHEDALFNLVAFEQEAIAPKAFVFWSNL